MYKSFFSLFILLVVSVNTCLGFDKSELASMALSMGVRPTVSLLSNLAPVVSDGAKNLETAHKGMEFLAACVDLTIPVVKTSSDIAAPIASPFNPLSWVQTALGVYSMGSMVFNGSKYLYGKTIGATPNEISATSQINTSESIKALEKIEGFDRNQLHILALLEKTKTPDDRFFRDKYKAAIEKDGVEMFPSDLEILSNTQRTNKVTRSGMMSCNLSSSEFGRLKYDRSGSDSDNDSGNLSAASDDDLTPPSSPKSSPRFNRSQLPSPRNWSEVANKSGSDSDYSPR